MAEERGVLADGIVDVPFSQHETPTQAARAAHNAFVAAVGPLVRA